MGSAEVEQSPGSEQPQKEEEKQIIKPAAAEDEKEIAEDKKPKAIFLKFDENDPIELIPLEEDRSSDDNMIPGLNLPAVKKFILERGLSVSSTLRRLSGLSEKGEEVKQLTEGPEKYKMEGRITLFSRSGCRDCRAVRLFFRERGIEFVEINIDVYPGRKAELEERAGKKAGVPQIFLNEHLLGGIVALNSLRNSGEFERRLESVVRDKRCPDGAPAVPVYGYDDDVDDDEADELWEVVSILRQRLRVPAHRFFRMRSVRNCFSGAEAVEVLIEELDCGRKKAVEVGKKIARKHFFHHVLHENDFEDGNHLYRFLEHDPIISTKCYNFQVFTNDKEPKPAALVAEKIRKIMIAIVETYVSDDGFHVNYQGICASEEFRRYLNVVQDLQRVDIHALKNAERLAFFLNIYNSMIIHGIIKKGYPDGILERREFFNEFLYLIGGYPYSLSEIQNGILRSNQRPLYSVGKHFKSGDKRLEVALPQANILTLFALCNGSKSSPALRFYSAAGVDAELRSATKDFFQNDGGIVIDIQSRTVHLSKLLKWFSFDFGEETEMLNWIMNYLDTKKAGLLSHILSNKGPINVVYQNYDWSINL